jgi:hypothetical protein
MAGAPWYRYNTVTVTNGSISVVGVGTSFLSQVSVGDAFTVDGTKFYEIALVVDDTHFNLQTAYTGSTASTTYGILRNFTTTTNAVLASQLTALLSSWQTREDQQRTWLAGALQAGFRIDGTPASPATTDPLAGYYPMSDAVGVTRYIPCPALLNKNGVVYGGAAGGTANALTLTPPSAMISYTTGIPITFQATADNTGATTVNVSGLGVKNIVSPNGTALRAADIKNGQTFIIIYNGTAFNLAGSLNDTTKASLATSNSFSDTTESSSISTGAMVIAGGVGIAKKLFVGGNANFAGSVATAALTSTSLDTSDGSRGLIMHIAGALPTLGNSPGITVSNGTGSAPYNTGGNLIITGRPTDTTSFGEIHFQTGASSADNLVLKPGGVAVFYGTVSTGALTVTNGSYSAVTTINSNWFAIRNGALSDAFGNYAFSQNGAGTTHVNAAAGQAIAFTVNDALVGQFDSSGNLLVGCTSVSGGANGNNNVGVGAGAGGYLFAHRAGGSAAFIGRTTDGEVMSLFSGTSQRGLVSISGATTTYSSYSDYRLKDKLVPIVDAVTRVMLLKPYSGIYKEFPGQTVDMFVAHEVQALVPRAVTGIKDEVDAEGKPIYQGLDDAKLIPLLTAALQDALIRLAALELTAGLR